MRIQAGAWCGMEVSPEDRLATKVKRGAAPEERMRVEHTFEIGRKGREAVAKVYETLLPRVRRVPAGPIGLSPSSDLCSDVKESCG